MSIVRRTRATTKVLAKALELDPQTFETVEYASFLVDVGMISIPAYILYKPVCLTEREMQKIRTHPEVGADILSNIKFQGPVIDIVIHHHENWDGSGYPDGLKGKAIPYGARIIAVANCYASLRTRRAYREAWDRNGAVALMMHESHRFDPDVFSKFLEVVPQIDEALEKEETTEELESSFRQ